MTETTLGLPRPGGSNSAVLWLLLAAPLAGQTPVRYEISFPNAVHHEAEISVTFPDLQPGPLSVRMSRTSPGRYALHEFAKNVYSVRAFDADGEELRILRPNPHQWDVDGHGGQVRITYTLFADRADGTFTGIDLTHGHLNMPGTFMWARGQEARPIRITFRPPAGSGWRVATQLAATDDPLTFTAPGLPYFLDSPTEVSDFALIQWMVDGPDGPQNMRLALHHRGTEAELQQYVENAKKVVAEQIAFFGGLPRFDYGTYTFIADYLPWVSGDGMEHRNSTILASTSSLASNASGLLGTLSHEFVHAWNVERIRPATLEPFDLEEANMSRELWFAEGFTSYIAPLAIRRAGLMDDRGYAAAISSGVNTVLTAPGRAFFSPVEMSMQAPFTDRASAREPHNRTNTFISYYTYGAALGLGLDLTLRSRFGLTLDHYLQEVWAQFGATEIPYDVEGLAQVLGQVTGNMDFAGQFFRRHITGTDPVDFRGLLESAGMLVRTAQPSSAWIGDAAIDFDDGVGRVGQTRIGTPLYEAGLDSGDRVTAWNGQAIWSNQQLAGLLSAFSPGDQVEVAFQSRGTARTAVLTLAENPALEVVLFEDAGHTPSEQQLAFRRNWLDSKGTYGR